jgi:hypothetical protein
MNKMASTHLEGAFHGVTHGLTLARSEKKHTALKSATHIRSDVIR